jgi:RNA-directed DNA polymerase
MESSEVSTKQRKIARLARIHPELSFTSLSYHIDGEWLLEAYRRTRKDGASGIDGQTAEEYERDLIPNLRSLLERFKSGKYFAPPVLRVNIPKPGKEETRPIGIPTLEDKVLQRAVLMLLEAIYEHDFEDCSYGFRVGRSAHQALSEVWNCLMSMRNCWVIDLDIRKFFDTMDHSRLRGILKSRVCDGVIMRIIGKWLKAGVMEAGRVSYPKQGTPQGGVISPLLSNIYLDEVLDKWFSKMVTPVLKGEAFMVRFADDALLVFSKEQDARRVLEVLPKRLEKYGLEMHMEKTKLIEFSRPASKKQQGKGGTFNFLGFTHYWGKSRKGNWIVKQKTEKSRLKGGLLTLSQWCKKNRHEAVAEQAEKLRQKLRGHYAYYGITGNYHSLSNFKYQVERIWRKWLNRRSNRRDMRWDKFNRLLKHYSLPNPRIVHSIYIANL